jgi:C-terminal processing protease CtpA/Prc
VGLFESGIYYFLVPVNADSSLLSAVEEAFDQIQEEQLQGLIFDLRIAHSTSEWPLGELLTAFADGELGTFISRDERRQLEITGQDFSGSQSIPLAVLVGPDTSGAPEIFASAVGESGRGYIIGLPTPGNVLGFEQVTLLDGSIIIFSTTTYETIAGDDLAQAGISPHILIEADWDQATMDTDPVLFAALERLLEEVDPP